MSSDRAELYKSMYHTMLIAADKAIDLLEAFQPHTAIADVLLEAMEECEEIYINSPLSDE